MRKIDKVRIYTGKKQSKTEKKGKGISFLCVLLAGMFGILFFLHGVEGIHYTEGLVWITVFLLCTGNWYLYTYRRWMFWCFFAAGIFFIGLVVFLMRETLLIQFLSVAEVLGRVEKTESMEVTSLVLLSAILFSFFLFLFELSSIGHELLILLTTALLLAGSAMGIWVDTKTVFFFLLFQMIFLAIHVLEKRKRKTVFLWVDQKEIADAVSISMGVLFIALFCLTVLTAGAWQEKIYDFTYDVEGYAYRTITNLMGLKEKPVKDGKISRSNNHQMGTTQLRIQMERQPTESLYLRGFSGEAYIGGDWTEASTMDVYEEVADKLNWTYWENHMGTMYSGMYYVINSRMQDNLSKSRTMTIQRVNKMDRTYYRPYYSQWQTGDADSWYDYLERREGYTYRYYEQKDMNIDWRNITADFWQTAMSYYQLQEAYGEVAKERYIEVPEELLPKLTTLCRENEFSDLDEISAFILYTLHSKASYTLTPGTAPLGEDIVEYFLFENGRGYCVHFAAAATLMYRLYGIPARYVSGYMVEPTEFERQTDGSYLAEVTDESAHAWVEILLEDYGWTPVEVTPARNATGEYPGFDSEEMKQLLDLHGWDMAVSGFEQYTQRQTDTEQRDVKKQNALMEKGNLGKEKETGSKEFIGFLLLVQMLLLIPLLLHYRRFYKREKMEYMGSRAIFFQLLRVLRLGGFLVGYEGLEDDFAEELTKQIDGIRIEEVTQMMEIVCEAAYGNREEEKEEREYVRRIYERIVGEIYEKLRWYQKLIFW